MTTTPKPLTENSDYRITEHLAPIGTRYADEYDTYTLVCHDVDPYGRAGQGTAHPRFIADSDLNAEPAPNWYDRMVNGSISLYEVTDIVGGDEPIALAEPDPDKAAAAQAALAARTEPTFRDTSDYVYVRLYADLNTDKEIEAFLDYAKAELKLREAQGEMELASRARSERIARIADLKGSQAAAAKLLGVNQSTVSRALRDRPERP